MLKICAKNFGLKTKALKIYIYLVCMKLFAWVPGPILLGHLFDTICEVKSDKENCVFYHLEKFRNIQYGILAAISILYAIVCLIFYYKFTKRLKSGKPMWGGMDTDKPF